MAYARPKYDREPIITRGVGFWRAHWNWLFATRWYYLLEDYAYRLPTGDDVVLPKDFRWNGASIPKPFSYFLHPVGILLIPGLLHDYAFRHACLKDALGNPVVEYNRRSANQMFLEVCTVTNGLPTLNFILFCVLALFSRRAWNKHR